MVNNLVKIYKQQKTSRERKQIKKALRDPKVIEKAVRGAMEDQRKIKEA